MMTKTFVHFEFYLISDLCSIKKEQKFCSLFQTQDPNFAPVLLFPTRSACTHSYLQFLPAFLVYITFQAFFQMLSLTCLYPKTYLIFKILLSLYRFLLKGRKAPSLSISLNTHCILKFSIVFF